MSDPNSYDSALEQLTMLKTAIKVRSLMKREHNSTPESTKKLSSKESSSKKKPSTSLKSPSSSKDLAAACQYFSGEILKLGQDTALIPRVHVGTLKDSENLRDYCIANKVFSLLSTQLLQF